MIGEPGFIAAAAKTKIDASGTASGEELAKEVEKVAANRR
jgi:hypothetical protein